MANEIIPPTDVQVPEPQQAQTLCRYCGAPLHPAFYFCLACATPYQNPDGVLPVSRPLELTEGQLVQRKAPRVAPLFWTFFSTVVGTAVLCLLIFRDREIGLHMLIQSVVLFVVTLVFASIHWKSLAVQFKRIGFLQWQPYLAFGLLAMMLVVNYFYHGFLRSLIDSHDRSFVEKLKDEQLSKGLLVLLICVLPAILEEIAFRGLVQHWLQTALRPWRAIIITSALFTVLHFSILSAPYIFTLSLLLGWTKWKTGSLYPCIIMHFLHNYVVITYMV